MGQSHENLSSLEMTGSVMEKQSLSFERIDS
jgi:hypothetical protein